MTDNAKTDLERARAALAAALEEERAASDRYNALQAQMSALRRAEQEARASDDAKKLAGVLAQMNALRALVRDANEVALACSERVKTAKRNVELITERAAVLREQIARIESEFAQTNNRWAIAIRRAEDNLRHAQFLLEQAQRDKAEACAELERLKARLVALVGAEDDGEDGGDLA